jgi:hypothetical protein
MEKEGAPVFQRTGVVPPGHGSASGLCVYIHYHQSNKAWVITQSVNSASVIAYSATADNRLETLGKLNGTWNVTEQNGSVRPVPPYASVASPSRCHHHHILLWCYLPRVLGWRLLTLCNM